MLGLFKDKKRILVVVGGGPAPGINSLIASIIIQGDKKGYEVFGVKGGLVNLANSDHVVELTPGIASHIKNEGGSIIGTSRGVAPKPTEVIDWAYSNGILNIAIIGGNGTAEYARLLGEEAKGTLNICHLPKTIDNDILLPSTVDTFGYQSARHCGVQIVERLMVDASTTQRWYIVIAMGRKAGHLSHGIGNAAGATLTLVPEMFDDSLTLDKLCNIMVGSIIKRHTMGFSHGAIVLAEGLAGKVQKDLEELNGGLMKDHLGRVRYRELEFGSILKSLVRNKLEKLGLGDLPVIDKNVGYELRCASPNSFDKEYTRDLGFGAVELFELSKKEGSRTLFVDEVSVKSMLTKDMVIDGRVGVRALEVDEDRFKISLEYMNYISKEDKADILKIEKHFEQLEGFNKESFEGIVNDAELEFGDLTIEFR